MSWKTGTQAVVLSVLAVLVVYDIIVYAVSGTDATISRVALGWSQDIPLAALAIGVVIGHLFWPQYKERP